MNTDNETFDTTSIDSNEENKCLESPIPSTSKTSHNTSQRHNKHCSCNLHKDAEFIKSLLPNIDYFLIYKTLCNNQSTNDRVKHTLCDLLLQMKRSSSINPHLANKRQACCSCVPCNIYPIKIRKNSINDEMEINKMEANQLDTSNDVNTCKNDLEELKSSENYLTNKELQSTVKLAMPSIKTEIDEIQSSTTISTPSIPVPNIALSSIAASNTDNQEILLNEEANKIYYELMSMFPNVDKFYIKQQCQQIYLTDSTIQYELLERLVEFLLENGENYSTIEEVELLEANNFTITYLNNHYADLLRIFPEANPTYLRRIVEENYKNPEQIQKFIQSKLRNPDYPTRAQYLAKKITEQQKSYTTNFNIQQFLQLFPDPFSHFENTNRKCKFNAFAVEFLMHYFSRIKVNTLLNIYSEHQYNLSLTVKVLETLSPDMKRKRLHNLMLPDDISLLQECAFIQHKLEFKKYLTELLKNQEFEKLKARNELVVCQCCFDEYIPSKCFMCENGHLFCNKCIAKYAELILTKGKAHINCLLNCGSEYPLSVLQQVLSATNIKILFHKRQAEIMVGLDNLISCPFCHFPSISLPEDKVFKCFNCMKKFYPYLLRHLYVEERTVPKMKNPFKDGSCQ